MRGGCGKAHFAHEVSQWNILPQKVVQPLSLDTTKTRLKPWAFCSDLRAEPALWNMLS